MRTQYISSNSPSSQKPLRFATISVVVASLFSHVTVTYAQMVAYKNGAGPKPFIDQTASGKTLVHIVAPNARGLSHNRYDQFNVDSNGVILNNSSAVTQTQIGGYVSANPNLPVNGSARIILNEVMGIGRSQLSGYIEVAGQRAEVIVANPNGISVGNGSGFINATRGVLTTGTPSFNGDGSLHSFMVRKGDITIGAGGLNGTGTDQLDVIARSVQVNDAIWANKLNVIAGSNQVDYSNLGVQVIAGEDGRSTVGIDSTALGGMYANQIVLIGTEEGVGVKALGTISASAGDLTIDSQGKVSLHNQTNAAGNVVIKSREAIHNSGELYGQRSINLSTDGRLSNAGTIGSLNDLIIRANTLTNDAGTLAQTGAGNMLIDVAGELSNSHGTIFAKGDTLKITSGNINNNDGVIGSEKDLTLQAISLTGSGLVVAGQDAVIDLQDDFTNTANNIIAANRDLTFSTRGAFINYGNLESMRHVTVNARSIDNHYGALINAGYGNTTLNAANMFYNMGRVYGNDVAIRAHIIKNDGSTEMDQAGVIASRNNLELGAHTIINREHAVMQSMGNMFIGAELDANHHAVGEADEVLNSSATIDAGGHLTIMAKQLNNVNAHFQTEEVDDPTLTINDIFEYQLPNSSIIYRKDQVRFITVDGATVMVLPDGTRVEDFYIRQYNQSGKITKVIRSDAAKIQSGGHLVLIGGNILNDKSYILAGETLAGDIANLTNIEVIGKRSITLEGTVKYHYVATCGTIKKHHCDKETAAVRYHPDLPDEEFDLSVGQVKWNADPTHQANDAIGTGVDTIAVPDGSQQAIPNLALPNSQLFPITTDPSATYLIETDPRFTNYRAFLSSDYMLSRMGLDAQAMQKRLGDGFYEQKLIDDQIAQLTGKRYLGDYTNSEEQFQALMESGIAVAEEFQLKPGIALSAAQMAALTSDMVWLVSQEITLPDGKKQSVLVPTVYLARTPELQANGSVISGRNVDVKASGNVSNGGTIRANNDMIIRATDINNTGTLTSNGALALVAANDVINSGGIISSNRVGIEAGHDVVLETKVVTATGENGTNSSLGRTSTIMAEQLGIKADRDVTLSAALIATSGDASLVAGRDINLASVVTQQEANVKIDSKNHLNQSQTSVNGTEIQSGGNISMTAGRDVNATAAYVNADKAISVVAVRDVNINSAQEQSKMDSEVYESSSGLLSSSSSDLQFKNSITQSIGTTLSGDSVKVVAGNDINVAASNIVGTNNVNVVAGHDIHITTSENTSTQYSSKEESKSGFYGAGGAGVTLGNKSQKDQAQDSSTVHQGSLIGSISGDVTIAAANDLSIKGSDVIAGNDITMAGRNIDISHVQNEMHHAEQHEMKQSGLTVSVSSPIINTATSVAQSVQRRNEVDNKRLKNLYAAKAGTSALVNYDDMEGELRQLAKGNVTSVSVNASIGSSQSKSTSESHNTFAQGSQIKAGGNLSLVAVGSADDKTQGNITVTGSQITGTNVAIAAANDIVLQSAQDTSSNRSENSSSGWSTGMGVGLGQNSGVTFSGNVQKANGNASGQSTTQVNTEINASNQLKLESGRDTIMQGAVANANSIQAEIGRDLTIVSRQDTEDYRSTQQSLSIGGSYTTGSGKPTANINISNSKTTADYASVIEQSGLNAGSGGFDIKVGNHTQLDGGIISSTADANKNSLSTASLSATTIGNHKQVDSQANSIGIEVGGGQYAAAKSALGGLLANANEHTSENSETRATISDAKVEIRNGDTSALETLNRDATKANNVLIKDDIQKIAQDTQDSSEAGQVISNIVTQFADKAHETLFEKETKTFRVVCKQEPCTYDPEIQSDPNRKDSEKNPNVVLVEMTQDDIKNLTLEEKKGMVIATNGILNESQRAAELALQNADANSKADANKTGNSKPNVILVYSPYTGNFISEFMVAGYEKVGSIFGYTNPDRAVATTLDNVGAGATILGHSRGSIVVDNALKILAEQGKTMDDLNVQVKGPAVSKEQITETTNRLRLTDESRQINKPEYGYFSNDPVPTFAGSSPQGKKIDSLLEFPNVVFSPNSSHSCYGTGVAGCKKIEKPYQYGDLNLVEMQKQRQEQVDNRLKGRIYNPILGVGPVKGLLASPIYFQKMPIWGIGSLPVTPEPSKDGRVNQIRELQQH